MSRHLHHAIANDVSRTLHQIKHMSKDEAEQLFGITFVDDGSIIDHTYNRTYTNLSEWAEATAELDEMDYSEDFGHGRQDYDDYY